MMGRWLDITGQQFDRLLVLRKVFKNKHGLWMWDCLCNCGNKKTISGASLRSHGTKSCGCKRGEALHRYRAFKILRDGEEYFLRKARRVGINRYE